MKVRVVGTLCEGDEESWVPLEGDHAVLLTGTEEEVRAAARFFATNKQVELVELGFTQRVKRQLVATIERIELMGTVMKRALDEVEPPSSDAIEGNRVSVVD
jgi:hypothetical protein